MQFFKTVIPKPDSSLPKFDNEKLFSRTYIVLQVT